MNMKKVGIKMGQGRGNRPYRGIPLGKAHQQAIRKANEPPKSHPDFPNAIVPGSSPDKEK
jgi:hypothetical protein